MLKYAATMPIIYRLAQKPEYNAPLLNVTERNCHENEMAAGNSVRIKDKISGCYMFAVDCWGELEELMDDVSDELDTFMVNTQNYKSDILKMFPGSTISEYHCYIMERKNYVTRSEQLEDFEITRLDIEWVGFILEHYADKEFGNEKYISHRIKNGPGLGLLYKGEKVAFVMQHKDGESGPLVVDEKFRGTGLGSELLKRFNGLLFETSSIAFGFVSPGNVASAHMMVSSGYRKTKNNILWVYRMKNGSLYLP